jgi:hypothetical protein
MSAAITVSYTYSLEHFRLLMRAIGQRRRRPLWQWILFALFLLAMAVLATVLEDDHIELGRVTQLEALLPLALVVIVLSLVLALINLVFHHFIHPLMFKRSGAEGARISYVIGDKSIQWTGPNASGVIQWPAISGVTRLARNDGLVLWTAPRAGLLLPSDAFCEGQDMEAVEKLATTRAAAGAHRFP